MAWTVGIFCVIGAWAVLSLLANDRSQRLIDLEARLRAEAEAANNPEREAPITVGPPPSHRPER